MNIILTQEQIDAYNYHLSQDHTTPSISISIEEYTQRILETGFRDMIKKKRESDLDSIKEITDALLKADITKKDQIRDILDLQVAVIIDKP